MQYQVQIYNSSLGGSGGKESACNAGDQGSIPRSGKSPEGGNGMGKYTLQCSCLKKKKPWTEEPGGLELDTTE